MPKTSTQSRIQSVKDIYEDIGAEFSSTRKKPLWPDIMPYLEKIQDGKSFLDVGCGNGRLLNGLPPKTKYTGIDFSAKLLSEAQKLHPEAHFIETDITTPNIWKHLGKFDYIFCIAVFHHLPDTKSQIFVLQEIEKHLKPDGQVLITAWNLWQKKYLKHHLDLATKWQNPHWVNIPFQGKPRFCYAYTKLDLQNLLKHSTLPLTISQSKHNYLLHTDFK